jgi:hypothetical protein
MVREKITAIVNFGKSLALLDYEVADPKSYCLIICNAARDAAYEKWMSLTEAAVGR